MMKLKNPAKLQAALRAALMVAIEREVLPVFRSTIHKVAMTLLTDTGNGYLGTPQWSGNAAANWYVTWGGKSASFFEYYESSIQDDSPYSALEPNREAVDLSRRRIIGALKQLNMGTVAKVGLQNPTPYLEEYVPYGGDKQFRMVNSPAASIAMAHSRLVFEFSTITRMKAAQAKGMWS